MSVNNAFIALGSNLEAPQVQVTNAIQEISALAQVSKLFASSLYQSTAIGPTQPDYINAVVGIHTTLNAFELLTILLEIEQQHHRKRRVKWGPRTLDCDILLFNDEVIDSPNLKIPHPEMKQRSFVVLPLFELNPELQLPDNTYIRDLVPNFHLAPIQQVESPGV